MKISIKNTKSFLHVSDNSSECDPQTAFLLTKLSEKYLEDARSKKCADVITPKDCASLLGIDEKIKIIGITGTNGKTTTSAAIYAILLELGKKVAFQGTRGFFINEKRFEEKSLTTPLVFQTLCHIKQALDEGCEYFVMEVSSHAISQNRIEGIDFALKILTNITQDHLDYHKTIEEYIGVKNSFFKDDSLKLINKDEPRAKFNPKNCLTYGIEMPATYKVVAYSLSDGIGAAISKMDTVCDFRSCLQGYFNVYNLLCAISAVDMLKVAPFEDICGAVESFGGVEGRMEVISEKPLVIVDFAHTPDGMEKVLESMKDKEIVLVFGAGGDRDKSKRPKMGFVAKKYAKKIVVTSDNSRSEKSEDIIRDILCGMRDVTNVIALSSREEAIEKALRWQDGNEVVLILGKGDEIYQDIGGVKTPFDDRVVAKEKIVKIGKFL
ncbi:MAG: UDP-N-acetylmuramoyl-L-alanyl-D-glutamate--2,6-diaminopimelate ligase [Sulfurospirillaceae bacterium]|nr:UDP-N-acetylmuramoyl-L-alanyl-D-glutamate--2,6-diaminopimelate ligase [Sulfurospirillaceae bacterium]